MKAEAVSGRAVRSACRAEFEKGVLLPPGAALFVVAAEARVHEHLRAAAPAAAAGIFELRAGPDGDDEKRRRARSSNEINERPVTGNKLVLEKAALEYLFWFLAARADGWNVDGEIADF